MTSLIVIIIGLICGMVTFVVMRKLGRSKQRTVDTLFIIEHFQQVPVHQRPHISEANEIRLGIEFGKRLEGHFKELL